jgi:hypothetical protein
MNQTITLPRKNEILQRSNLKMPFLSAKLRINGKVKEELYENYKTSSKTTNGAL